MKMLDCFEGGEFYNHLILSGTKMKMLECFEGGEFYNHLILSGTKIGYSL